MSLPIITMECRAVADPELRFAPSGVAIANLRTVCDQQKKDPSSGEWVDDKECWLSVTFFKGIAEHVAESVIKGDLVVVTGKLQTRSFEDREGNKRQVHEVIGDSIGLSLKWRDARSVESAQRTAKPDTPGTDPWATPPASDEPPF